MSKKIKLNRAIVLTFILLLSLTVMTTVYAATATKEKEFSTVEVEGSILSVDVANEQVRSVKRDEIRKQRKIEEIAEAERLAEEERLAEAERIAEEERLVKEEETRLANEEQTRFTNEQEAKEKEEQLVQAKEAEEVKEVEEKPVTIATASVSADTPTGNNLGTFQSTSYTANCTGCSGITANGTDMNGGSIHTAQGYRIIAADTSVIPMNSIVRITFSSGQTMMAQVADTGGAINGKIIDIAQHSKSEALSFGRQSVQIEIIN